MSYISSPSAMQVSQPQFGHKARRVSDQFNLVQYQALVANSLGEQAVGISDRMTHENTFHITFEDACPLIDKLESVRVGLKMAIMSIPQVVKSIRKHQPVEMFFVSSHQTAQKNNKDMKEFGEKMMELAKNVAEFGAAPISETESISYLKINA